MIYFKMLLGGYLGACCAVGALTIAYQAGQWVHSFLAGGC